MDLENRKHRLKSAPGQVGPPGSPPSPSAAPTTFEAASPRWEVWCALGRTYWIESETVRRHEHAGLQRRVAVVATREQALSALAFLTERP